MRLAVQLHRGDLATASAPASPARSGNRASGLPKLGALRCIVERGVHSRPTAWPNADHAHEALVALSTLPVVLAKLFAPGRRFSGRGTRTSMRSDCRPATAPAAHPYPVSGRPS